MEFREYSHRHADAIIKNDKDLRKRYDQFVGALRSISEEELITDFLEKKKRHSQKGTSFKSITPSINGILKERILDIPGWKAEVDIFNDTTGVIGNTEWRLDFACDDAFCVEVAFNHVEKAVQGQIGIYVCATDNMKKVANIDSASGSFEKVLRYLPPMMNQLTIPMVIIGLEPFETFKINDKAEIVRRNYIIDDSLLNQRVRITKADDYATYIGDVIDVKEIHVDGNKEKQITIQKPKRKSSEEFIDRMIKFLEIL